jgi:hypothetical protein
VLAVSGAATGIIFGFVGLSGFDVWVRLWTAAAVALVVLAAISIRRSGWTTESNRPDRRRGWLPPEGATAWLVTVVTAAVLFPLLTSAAAGWPVSLNKVSASASFTFPEDGDDVESPFYAQGAAKIPQDYSLWILTRPENNLFYTNNLKPLLTDSEGKWEYRMGIGQGEKDKGRRFDLFLVGGIAGETELEREVQKRLDDDDEGAIELKTMPQGVEILDRVKVTLLFPEGK